MKTSFSLKKAISFFVVILSLIIICCGGKTDTDILKIGVCLPLSGDAAIWGQSLKEGYEFALKQINSSGGVNGKKIRLVYEDDQALPKVGVSVVQKMIDIDNIKVITGVANSSVALALTPIIDRNKVLFISSGASSPKLSGSSRFFFRTWPSDAAEALAMAKFAYGNLNIRKLAILYINNEYGLGLKEPFSRRFIELGGEIIGEESFEQSAIDYRVQLAKIKNLDFDGIYLAGNPREMARCIKQAKELGITKQILSISTLNEQEVFNIAGEKALEGIIITDASFDPHRENEATQKFIREFRGLYNKEPGLLAVTAYDALFVIIKAIEKVGLNPVMMAEYLRNMKDYNGASGIISFDKNGDVKRNIRIAIVKNGRFETLVKSFMW